MSAVTYNWRSTPPPVTRTRARNVWRRPESSAKPSSAPASKKSTQQCIVPPPLSLPPRWRPAHAQNETIRTCISGKNKINENQPKWSACPPACYTITIRQESRAQTRLPAEAPRKYKEIYTSLLYTRGGRSVQSWSRVNKSVPDIYRRAEAYEATKTTADREHRQGPRTRQAAKCVGIGTASARHRHAAGTFPPGAGAAGTAQHPTRGPRGS